MSQTPVTQQNYGSPPKDQVMPSIGPMPNTPNLVRSHVVFNQDDNTVKPKACKKLFQD